jgi:hypothetical protein
MTVLDLGWLTVGTADTSHMVVWQWFADLFVDPEHGVARYASDGVAEAIRGVGGLCMRKANGECVSSHEWRHARIAAAAAAYAAADVDAYAAADAAAYAYAAAYAAAAKDAAAYAYAAAYAAAAADPAADPAAAAAADAYARIDFVRWAIQRWRQLAQLDTPTEIPATAVNDAVARIGGQA